MGLTDKKGHRIKIGDKVKLLTKSTKKSPFTGQQFAKVIGIAHNGTSVGRDFEARMTTPDSGCLSLVTPERCLPRK